MVLMDQQVHRAPLGHKGQRELQEPMVLMDQQVHRGQLDHKDQRELQEPMVQTVQME